MRKTGIRDVNGDMVHEGDKVCFPHIDENDILLVVFVGDGGDMDWAADRKDGLGLTPDSWLDQSCKIVS